MGKNVLITGCSSGFGLMAAKHLAKNGHTVFASMRGVAGKNSAVASELREFAASNDLSIEVIELDVTSDESVATAVSSIPSVDVLINNAGMGYGGPVEAFSTEQVRAQLDVNVLGIFRVSKAVLPGMRAKRFGLIIQLSSIAGRLAVPGFGIYHASKWAVEGMSDAMRLELGPLGIDVALIEPGPFHTSFFDNVLESADSEDDYAHVGEYLAGFNQSVDEAFNEPDAPTDPMLVVQCMASLIAMAPGSRPLRSVVGIDFGAQAVNDAIAPLRDQLLAENEIADWDGARN